MAPSHSMRKLLIISFAAGVAYFFSTCVYDLNQLEHRQRTVLAYNLSIFVPSELHIQEYAIEEVQDNQAVSCVQKNFGTEYVNRKNVKVYGSDQLIFYYNSKIS